MGGEGRERWTTVRDSFASADFFGGNKPTSNSPFIFLSGYFLLMLSLLFLLFAYIYI